MPRSRPRWTTSPARPKLPGKTPLPPGIWPPTSDRDVAEITAEFRDFRQATVGSFNALRPDLTNLRAEVRTGLADLRAQIGDLRAEMGVGFAEVRGRLDRAAAGFEQITRPLTR